MNHSKIRTQASLFQRSLWRVTGFLDRNQWASFVGLLLCFLAVNWIAGVAP